MKKVLAMVAFVMFSVIVYAFNDKPDTNQGKQEVTGNGEVVVMNKEMFLKDVFDYEKSKEWKYKGDKPAIIDLYARGCCPIAVIRSNISSTFVILKFPQRARFLARQLFLRKNGCT